MGREYFGDISGKFAFGIQSSCDIQNLIRNITYVQEYVWYGCGCTLDNPNNTTSAYCIDCYENYDQHFQDVGDWLNGIEDNKTESGSIQLFGETSQIIFNIKKSDHLAPLLDTLAKLKILLPKMVIDQFSKIEDHEEIVDGYSKIYRNMDYEIIKAEMEKDADKHNTLWEYYFRYVLGLQIKYVLLKQEECFVSCET